MTVDLHIHSTFSDGSKSPCEIVELAVKCGVTTVALTDHDTMDGTGEFMDAAGRAGIVAVPGLELSVVYQRRPLHILGYYLDEKNKMLQSGLARIQKARDERNVQILEKLNRLGIKTTPEELQKISAHGQAGRPHIGALLVKHGAVKSIDQAFEQYLRKGACGYVARREFSATEAISLIRQAGGVAVLAHPVQFSPSLKELPALLESLVPAGLAGVEMFYPTQKKQFRKKLRKLTSQYDLIFTGGSDYHGGSRFRSAVGIGLSQKQADKMMDSMKSIINNYV